MAVLKRPRKSVQLIYQQDHVQPSLVIFLEYRHDSRLEREEDLEGTFSHSIDALCLDGKRNSMGNIM